MKLIQIYYLCGLSKTFLKRLYIYNVNTILDE